MRLHSSSISSFNSGGSPAEHVRGAVGDAAVTLLWTLVFLAVIDVAINRLFAYPTDPRSTSPTQLQQYFEYGRSAEGKLRRMVQPTDEATAPIALIGWLDPLSFDNRPSQPAPGSDLLVSVYGMSFSQDLGAAIKKADPRITIRAVTAPAAPGSYSYAAYQMDRGRHQAHVAILGVMAANVAVINTMSPVTWNDAAYPYTYPRYRVESGQIQTVRPVVQTLSHMRAALGPSPSMWREYCEQLSQHDECYSTFLVRQTVLDRSSLCRLARRGWSQPGMSRVHGPRGFDPGSEQVLVLRALVADFARCCRKDGVLPIVFLIDNLGYADHLFATLRPVFEREPIPVLSSHALISPADPRNYIGGGHFTAAGNALLAKDALRLINDSLKRRPVDVHSRLGSNTNNERTSDPGRK